MRDEVTDALLVPGTLAQRILRRDPLAGIFISCADPALSELAAGPFDFVVADLEHGALGPRDLQAIAIGARAAGRPAIVRLPGHDPESLTAFLDTGIEGVMVPNVEAAREAERLLERLRYPPAGSRGFGLRRSGSYARDANYWTRGVLTCLVQVETVRGVEAASEIACVDGVHALVVGLADLSFSLGAPLDSASDSVVQAVEAVQAAADEAGIASGIAGAPRDRVAEFLGGHSTLVFAPPDLRIYADAVDACRRAIADALAQPTPSRTPS